MAELTFIEKKTIENFLEMKSGYVMDFNNRTFQEFIGEATSLDIFDEKYKNQDASNSKANLLRNFMKVEPNYIFGKLLSAFCSYWLSRVHDNEIDFQDDENVYKECLKISERLKQESIVEQIDAIQPNSDDKDFALLAKSIKESIEKNEPETALDRLHTFTVKYIRQLCDNHGLTHNRDEALNSIFGKYIKYIKNNNLIDSEMAEKILKFSINIIEAFNDVRNNKSFAHDNPILNYDESILIFNNISNIIKFIEKVENRIQKSKEIEQVDWTDLPF